MAGNGVEDDVEDDQQDDPADSSTLSICCIHGKASSLCLISVLP